MSDKRAKKLGTQSEKNGDEKWGRRKKGKWDGRKRPGTEGKVGREKKVGTEKEMGKTEDERLKLGIMWQKWKKTKKSKLGIYVFLVRKTAEKD